MSFEDLKLSNEIKDAIKRMDYAKATNVQADTIPLILEGHNVIVKSHTGSGKTAAFGIPISENIFRSRSRACLIICPTRELTVQVKDELRGINARTRLNVQAFYGGHGMSAEMRAAREGIDILCATPGRLLDHFRNRSIDPRHFDTVVLDEADRILDMGFIHDLRKILEQVQPKHTHMFSATLDGKIAHLIQQYIPTYEEIIMSEEIIGKDILERHIKVQKDRKISALVEILEEAKGNRVLVFVSTKRNADFLARKLQQHHYAVESIHGDKSQRSREFALDNFRKGKVSVLVATDVAARGLQIDDVEYVVNYDLANDADTHKHRIGRTGRMGDTGHAISFVGDDGRFIRPQTRFGGGGFRSQSSSNFRGQSHLWKSGHGSSSGDSGSAQQEGGHGRSNDFRGGNQRGGHFRREASGRGNFRGGYRGNAGNSGHQGSSRGNTSRRKKSHETKRWHYTE